MWCGTSHRRWLRTMGTHGPLLSYGIRGTVRPTFGLRWPAIVRQMWGNSMEIKHSCDSGGSNGFCCWDRRRKHSWRVRGQTLYFLSLGTMWLEEREGETEGYEREGGLLDFSVSLFSTLLHPSCHFWHLDKLADMFKLYIFWPPGLPAASVWSVLVGTSAGSPLHHLPGLCPVCCFLQGPLVPSDPQWGALDGGDLLVAPVFVFPSPAVGPAKHPA